MRISRFFVPEKLSENSLVNLNATSSHYLLTVLRLKVGSALIVFNGEGGEFEATLEAIAPKKSATIRIGKYHAIAREALSITLAQGISRSERMDYAIQKSVELGVTEIVPLMTSHAEVKLKAERLQSRMTHWNNLIISACEQSGRCIIPKLHQPVELMTWIHQTLPGLKLVCVPRSTTCMNKSKISAANILIGPEGGLSLSEIESAKKAGFLEFSLGPRILRTETAAVVALTLVQSQWGDMSL